MDAFFIPSEQYDVLLLNGCGLKGLLQLGSLHYYQKNIKDINYFLGSSIGSMICILLIIGYTPFGIFKEFNKVGNIYKPRENLKCDESEDEESILKKFMKSVYNKFEDFGLLDIDDIFSHVEMLFSQKYPINITLQELFKKTSKTFHCSGSNMTKKHGEYFSHITTPNIPALEAVKISCCLPGICKKRIYNNNSYLDGGLTDNLPVDMLPKEFKRALAIVIWDDDCKKEEKYQGFWRELYDVIMLPTRINQEINVKRCYQHPKIDIIEIIAKDTPLLELDMSSEQKMKSFLRGYKKTKEYNMRKYLTSP